MSADCIFCKIVGGQIPSEKLFEDDHFICIKDINPAAEVHLLVLPKKHIETLEKAIPGETELMGRMLETVVKVAQEQKLVPHGFRTVINTNKGGGQEVFHIHTHILHGERLRGLG